MHSPTVEDSPLGAATHYPTQYDASLLFPIPRAQGRAALGLHAEPLPFHGHDRWNAYELSWLDAHGKPQVATAMFTVPADSPHLIESKSFKLYLNSLNAHRLDSPEALQLLVERDLSHAAGAPVAMQFGLPALETLDDVEVIDGADIHIHTYGPPDAALLTTHGSHVQEALRSHLLKSNCPVTGQPDWATLDIRYAGQSLCREGLLRYIVSYRDHGDFHEQCAERIFRDLWTRCQPEWLEVEARYTRRGGLDINPWRGSPGRTPPPPRRTERQ